jgi:GNAT superfamily N-acetyltransferase
LVTDFERRRSSLRVAGVVPVNALWKQPFATALAAACQSGPAPFGPHPRTETVLAFPGSLGWLISAFHKTGNHPAGSRAGYSRGKPGIVNATTSPLGVHERGDPSSDLSVMRLICQRAGAIYKVAKTAHFWNNEPQSMAEKENVVIEPATEADLDELSEMLGELFSQESDFRPDKDKQLRGLRLIFEQPSRGRVFVLRRNGAIVGMINLLFTISTAEGGFVILLEDLVIHKQYQGKGYGNKLLEHAIDFAKKKNFLRITLLTDRPENVAQAFFRKHGFVDSSMIPMRLWIAPQNEQT